MSARANSALLRLYPPAWRARYGAELDELITASRADGGKGWRTTADVLAAAARERVREHGLVGGAEPEQRATSGLALVLCAWALMVLGGGVMQRFSEHWQALTPASAQGLPAAAFDVLVGAGVLGCGLVGAGILIALPRLAALLREGGGHALRGGARRALLATVLTGVATVGLASWAHGLGPAARNGGDVAYSIAFLAWGALGICCLAAWSALAVACARRVKLSVGALRLEATIAVGVAAAALCATVASCVWWGALAAAAPLAVNGAGGGPVLVPQLLIATSTMALGSLLACAGARRAAHELLSAGRR